MNGSYPQDDNKGKAGLGLVLFLCRALACSVEVFLHDPRTFGRRYQGLQAGAALLLMLFFPAFWEGHDPEPLFLYLCAFVGICLCIRVAGWRRRGSEQHSFYSGTPLLLGVVGRHLGEVKTKAAIEPLVVWGVGSMVQSHNEPFGVYLELAAVGLLISVNAALYMERRRALDMHDAFVEQRSMTERFRKMRGE